ncbi:MAG: hypothetical protein KAT05_03905, partial [Spirochaetes bacterium]|nr:hypothetical protein [Spirochaetota bacterium]
GQKNRYIFLYKKNLKNIKKEGQKFYKNPKEFTAHFEQALTSLPSINIVLTIIKKYQQLF